MPDKPAVDSLTLYETKPRMNLAVTREIVANGDTRRWDTLDYTNLAKNMGMHQWLSKRDLILML